jgi:phosphoenolpyruvate-protein phosphotransferase (PTS system enzyme I)
MKADSLPPPIVQADAPPGRSVADMILGEVASSGLAKGRALLCDCAKQTVVPRRNISEMETETEIKRLAEAVDVVEQKLREVQAGVRRALGNTEAEIFEAQILLLRDTELHRAVRDVCVNKRINVEAALEESIQRLSAVFDQFDDPYLRERGADLREVGKRLIDHLVSQSRSDIPPDPEGCVLVTTELFSAAVAQLEGRGVRGLIVERGGLTAHATILARALGLPMLVKVPQATERISAGDLVIVDALAGRAFINPKPDILRAYDQLEADLRAHKNALQDSVDLPAITRDGTPVKLSANIGQTADAVAAARVKADGAGLYRTEFVFLAQDHFPSEAEQYHFYRATAENMKPGETVIRVLDVGSDKPLSYLPLQREANPALGCRGVQLLLAHPEILRTQLRAILRLSATHSVSLLLPMIRGLDELHAVKAVIESVKRELGVSGVSFDSKLRLGAMIETPAAAILIAQLADDVDFFSVGTNDLVQYLLAADRLGNDTVSAYEPLHPSVIQILASLAVTASIKGKPISLCGEIASDPVYTALLLGLGFRSFSVSPGRLLEIKHAIRSIDMAVANQLAATSLSLGSGQEIRICVQEDWSRRRPVSSPDLRSATPHIAHDAATQRFETRAGDDPVSFLSYTFEGDSVLFDHTFVPEALRGRGIASKLVRAALNEARQRRWRIVPRCSYVAAFIKRNSEFADLVSRRSGP